MHHCISLRKINISESALPAAEAGKYTEGADVFRISAASPHSYLKQKSHVGFVRKGGNVVYLTKLPAALSRLELVLVNKWALTGGNVRSDH